MFIVFFSYEESRFALHIPPGPVGVPGLRRIENNVVYFEDDSDREVDEIVLCTGYLYTYPFLSEKCKIMVDDNYIKGLYKECLCLEYPTLMVMGVPGSVCPIPTFEIQMRFLFAVLNGRFKVPPKEEMLKETEDRRIAKGCKNRRFHKKGVKEEREYWDDLAQTASVKRVPNVITKLHEWVFTQKRNPDQSFRIVNEEEFENIV